jgi:5'-3' exonuclease
MPQYLKFILPFQVIQNIIDKYNFKQIIFYTDIMSISRGFFNVETIHFEIDNYINNKKQMPNIFFNEYRDFFNNIYNKFKKYSPTFITFYDDGKCIQNRTIYKPYKADRGTYIDKVLLEDAEKELFKQIKTYYYDELPNKFTIKNLSTILSIKDYETDFIPHIIISNNYINSQSPDILNVILSTDKDLLQTCQFKNVLQCCTLYSPKEGKLKFYTLTNDNAIEYIYKNFEPGLLTAKYIPLLLALSGDKADNIPGIKGIGEAKACKLITLYNLPSEIHSGTDFKALTPNKDIIIRNFKLISFEEQIKRVPITFCNSIKLKLESNHN